MLQFVAASAILLVPTLALAGVPEMAPVTALGANLRAPQGWVVKSTTQPVPTIEASARPGDPTSPSLLFMTFPLQSGQDTPRLYAQQLLQTVEGGRLVRRGRGPGTSTLEIWDGKISGHRGRVALLYAGDPRTGAGSLAVFAAPPKRFAALGGHALLFAAVGAGSTQAPPPSARPSSASGPVRIPRKYRGSSEPRLYYLADALFELKAAQVAELLEAMDQTERLSLGIYGAFANLAHGIGCGANGGLVLRTSAGVQGCRATMQQWVQTLQLLQGDKRAALDYALRQREQILIAQRCSNGQLSKASCNAYIQQRRQDLTRSHNTMTRVIANLGNGCIVGDPGCLPY